MGPVSPAHSSPSPQPASFHEDEGLADGPWLPLVWTPSPGNHAVWGLGGPKPPSTAHPATVLHLNPLPHRESKAGETSAREIPEPLCAPLQREPGMDTQEENPSSTRTQVCGRHFINIMIQSQTIYRLSLRAAGQDEKPTQSLSSELWHQHCGPKAVIHHRYSHPNRL